MNDPPPASRPDPDRTGLPAIRSIEEYSAAELRDILRQRAREGDIPRYDPDANLLANGGPLSGRSENTARYVAEYLGHVAGHWPYPPGELHLMASMVAWYKPEVIIEWGTHIGASARVFWYATRSFGVRCEIHSIDLPPDVAHHEHPGERRAELINGLDGIQLWIGDGLTKALEIADGLPADRRIAFFVDGDHRYETVVHEVSTLTARYQHAPILLHDTHPWPTDDCPARALADMDADLSRRYQVVSVAATLPGMTLLIPKVLRASSGPGHQTDEPSAVELERFASASRPAQ